MGFSEDVLRRMTIVIPANETIGSHNVGTKAIRISTKEGVVLLNFLEISSEEQPDLRIGVTGGGQYLDAFARKVQKHILFGALLWGCSHWLIKISA